MDTLRQDLRFALRMFRKSPGFTAIAVVALALGIGSNATVFTLVNAVLFKNLPFANSERVLYVSSINRATGRGRGESYPDFRDFQSQVKAFEALGAFSRNDVDVSDKSGLPTQFRGATLTINTFSLIGQKPIIGRDFLPEDAKPGAAPVAILAYELWQARYNKSVSLIGSTIRINDIPTAVIGVMPPSVQFPGQSDLWTPLIPIGDWEKREVRGLTMFGRLAPNAGLASSTAEMNVLARQLERAYPDTNKDIGVRVVTFNDYSTDSDTKLIYLALLGAVGFVLLIACANVANLLLSRAVGRAREISIRAALGAGRWRVIRQLLVESILLSSAGGVLGTFAGVWGVSIYEKTFAPGDSPAYITYTLDSRVIVYLIAITLITGILFGLAPALRLSRLDINTVLKDGGSGSGTSSGGRKLSTALVVTEMALAFVLLIGAGLMIRSFLIMTNTPIGVRTDHILSMDINLRDKKYPSTESQITFHRQLEARLQSLPGVTAVAMASSLPGDGWINFTYELDGTPPLDTRKRPRAGGILVSPDYFKAMEVRPNRGRVFSELDGVTGAPVAIVNQAFATASWPGEEALGKRLRVVARPPGAPRGAPAVLQPWMTVVGVIPDIVQNDSSAGAHDPLIYIPYRELTNRDMVVIARTAVPPGNLGDAFRTQVQAVDENLPVTDLRTLESLLRDRTWTWRVYGAMFSIFAVIALLLASLGLYAVVAYSVSQRRQEFGVRMALGASRSNILGLVFAQGMRHVVIGLVVGMGAAFGLTRILGSLLVGVKPADPITFVFVAAVLTIAGVLGCAIPAKRATNVDPIIALRYE
jgi:putative ABC transport system permease protein